ncbi:hypothetical protein [Glaciihabitans sp. dw_435]|uniref:hypothetical protein n=1 Tax=Glaciihabitans sp. dw_435 TaxID=2720081 RepID=UPI001BD2158E|nr:hypothetical protein [Glaciihabitans sp. dw_435]
MDRELEERLSAHLQVDVSPAAIRETKRLGLAAGARNRSNTRFRALITLAITGGLLVGGSAVAYAAPQTWAWLFPQAVSKSFTFPGQLECVANITASANYSAGKPTPSEVADVLNAARRLQLDDNTVLGYLADAERDAPDSAGATAHVAERQALIVAIQNQMFQLADPDSGATWSVSTSCR